MTKPYLIDCLQYANWSEKIFRQMREGGVDAVHVTIAYHENFRETVLNIESWNRWFELFPDLICHARTGDDIRMARKTGRTAILFGFQNPSPIEDDIGLVEVVHTLGARFMQLSYNNQSLLATGCYETEDPGLTRMGRQVVTEMNRVGLVLDMSHSSKSDDAHVGTDPDVVNLALRILLQEIDAVIACIKTIRHTFVDWHRQNLLRLRRRCSACAGRDELDNI